MKFLIQGIYADTGSHGDPELLHIKKKEFCMGGLFDHYEDTDMAVNDASE